MRGTTQEQKEIKIPFESLDPLRSVLKKPEEWTDVRCGHLERIEDENAYV